MHIRKRRIAPPHAMTAMPQFGRGFVVVMGGAIVVVEGANVVGGDGVVRGSRDVATDVASTTKVPKPLSLAACTMALVIFVVFTAVPLSALTVASKAAITLPSLKKTRPTDLTG